jgi:phosphate transport system protein
MLHTPHTATQYDSELSSIESEVVSMFSKVEEMLRAALLSVKTKDPQRARAVISADSVVDHLEMAIDEMIQVLLARRSPVGGDLRFAVAVLKMVTDIERIGDLACNLAERAIELGDDDDFQPPPQLQALEAQVLDELQRVSIAFQRRDSALARVVKDDDDAVDVLNRAAFAHLIAETRNRPDMFQRALSYASICRHLERVGDHVCNLAERVVFIVEGEEIRHGGARRQP